MACSPTQIEGCPDLPPRPPLRRTGVARCFLSGCPLSDFGDDDYAVRIVGCTMRAIDQTNAANSRAIATTMTFCGLPVCCRRR